MTETLSNLWLPKAKCYLLTYFREGKVLISFHPDINSYSYTYCVFSAELGSVRHWSMAGYILTGISFVTLNIQNSERVSDDRFSIQQKLNTKTLCGDRTGTRRPKLHLYNNSFF